MWYCVIFTKINVNKYRNVRNIYARLKRYMDYIWGYEKHLELNDRNNNKYVIYTRFF